MLMYRYFCPVKQKIACCIYYNIHFDKKLNNCLLPRIRNTPDEMVPIIVLAIRNNNRGSLLHEIKKTILNKKYGTKKVMAEKKNYTDKYRTIPRIFFQSTIKTDEKK
ncbi:hypothetical protein C7E23_07830 [Elizabethkingia anophelis]|nr:hypothetical protein C7E23_07830 [Elizabethkingia anophelis]